MVRSGRAGARSRRFIGIEGERCSNQHRRMICRRFLSTARLIQQALECVALKRAAYGESDQPIEVSAARDDSTLVISVADRGPGLAPGEENKVFRKVLSRSANASRWSRSWAFHRPATCRSARRSSSSRKIAKAAAHDFPFGFPLVNRCDCQAKRPRE